MEHVFSISNVSLYLQINISISILLFYLERKFVLMKKKKKIYFLGKLDNKTMHKFRQYCFGSLIF